MNQLPAWSIGKDNQVRGSPYEWRQLRTKYHLTGRTAFVECPNYKDVDQASARLIAETAKSSAVIGGCSYIVVRGPRWKYEFNVRDINGQGEWWGQREGMFQNPLELQQAGCFFDAVRKLWQVPSGFGEVRERKVFPMESGNDQ